MSQATTSNSLKRHFERYGEVVHAVVKTDRKKVKSKGFGFVTFSDEYMVDEALKNRPHFIDYRAVDTKRAIPHDLKGKPDVGTFDSHGSEHLCKLFI